MIKNNMNKPTFMSRRFHFILDAFNCDVRLLSDRVFLEELVRQITKLLDMKILKGPECAEGIPINPGLSVFAIIDFSHISIHTFTNSKEFCLDIFSCKYFDYKVLEEFIKHKFKLKNSQLYKSIVRYDQFDVERGIMEFDPNKYLDEYYKGLSPENKKLLDWYSDIYSDIQPQGTLLEIGGGPTIYQLISASEKVEKIIFTDYFQKNLDNIIEWQGSKNSFWDKFIEYSLGGGSIVSKAEISSRKNDIASKIKTIKRLDISEINNELSDEKYDIVQSSFCLESSTDDISQFKRMLGNINNYLKPGGIFIMTALEGAIVYKIGKKYLPAIYLDKEIISGYLRQFGFKITRIDKILSDNSEKSKYHGFLLIKAIKM